MISTLYLKRLGEDPQARILCHRLVSEGQRDLREIRIEKVFRFEGVDLRQALRMRPLLCHPETESLSEKTHFYLEDGPIVEIGFQRAVTDPELPSIQRSAEALGVHGLDWVRISTRTQFIGIDRVRAEELAVRYLYNPQVQVILTPGETWDTLKPQGQPGPVEPVPLAGLDDEALLGLSKRRRLFLDRNQMRALQAIAQKLGRPMTDAEVEMLAQTWSDHCFHTTWKSLGLLQTLFKTTQDIGHPLVLSVFEDNAGAMEFYDGWALTIKGETHNSPTAVSPYGGIMTKHGGVIRDTLGCGQGAWPIGGSTVMGLGDPRMPWDNVPQGALHPKTILLESIRGTADYVNPMGIPMMFPVYRFHPGYTGKCFALGHSIGLIPADKTRKGRPRPGDIALLIGGLTGRDGLHGATVSSGSMTSETAVVDAAHVQIGHPIEERKFMEAIPSLRDQDCIRAITDLGAGGLSSSAGEMGSSCGVWINLAWVPLKTEGLHPWEIWISESQERMLVCIPPDRIPKALEILQRFEVQASVVGVFTDSRRCQVVYDPDADHIDPEKNRKTMPPFKPATLVVDLDFLDLRKGCPLPKIKTAKPSRPLRPLRVPPLKWPDGFQNAVLSVLGHLNVCDQSVAGKQFDNTVQGFTAIGPYGGIDGRMPNDVWVSSPIRGKPYGAAAAVAFNPLYGDVNPALMSALMMVESVSKLVVSGIDPSDVVLCDNFYTPKVIPQIAYDLKQMVQTCCRISRRLGIPFISGKDSSSGTYIGADGRRIDIPPTLAVLALGRTPDVRKMVPKPFRKAENALFLVGPLSTHLGGSVYLDTLGLHGGPLPDTPIEKLLPFWKRLRKWQSEGIVLSGSALSEGGLVRRLFEMALGSGLGCTIDLGLLMSRLGVSRPEIGLFAEMIGAAVVEIDPIRTGLVKPIASAVPIGRVIEEPLVRILWGRKTLEIPMDALIKSWESPFPQVAR